MEVGRLVIWTPHVKGLIMSCGIKARYNYDSENLVPIAAGTSLQFASGTSTSSCISCDGTNIIFKKPGTYTVMFNATLVASAEGTNEVQLYRNGVAVPGAHAVASAVASGDYMPISFNSLITVPCTGTSISFQALDATQERIASAIII